MFTFLDFLVFGGLDDCILGCLHFGMLAFLDVLMFECLDVWQFGY